MPNRKNQVYIYLIILGISVASFYYIFQPAVNYQRSPLSDSNQYEKIYNFFQGNTNEYQLKFPYNTRVLIPFLAARLCVDDINFNFFIINALFSILAILSIYKLMDTYGINPKIALLSILWISIHWAGPFRQNAFNPVNVDIPVYFFEVMMLLLFTNKKYVYLLIVSVVAIVIKEVFLALLMIMLFITVAEWFFVTKNSNSLIWISTILGIGILIKVYLNFQFPSVNNSYSILTMLYALREIILHPLNIVRWLLAFFTVFASFTFSLSFTGMKFSKFNVNPSTILFIMTVAVILLSFLGGMDYTRLIMLGFPYLMTSIILIVKPSFREFLMLFLLSLPLSKFWMVRTDTDLAIDKFKIWMPEYADNEHLIFWIIAAMANFLIVWYGRKNNSLRRGPE